jgi:hypothetical protein
MERKNRDVLRVIGPLVRRLTLVSYSGFGLGMSVSKSFYCQDELLALQQSLPIFPNLDFLNLEHPFSVCKLDTYWIFQLLRPPLKFSKIDGPTLDGSMANESLSDSDIVNSLALSGL